MNVVSYACSVDDGSSTVAGTDQAQNDGNDRDQQGPSAEGDIWKVNSFRMALPQVRTSHSTVLIVDKCMNMF